MNTPIQGKRALRRFLVTGKIAQMLGIRRPGLMVMLMPIVVGSVAASIVLVNASARRRALRNFVFNFPRAGSSPETLSQMRYQIAGFGKRQILSILGPPRAEKGGRAETWYYSVSDRERLALAISFQRGRANQIEFVQLPPLQTKAHNS